MRSLSAGVKNHACTGVLGNRKKNRGTKTKVSKPSTTKSQLLQSQKGPNRSVAFVDLPPAFETVWSMDLSEAEGQNAAECA